MPEVGIRKKLLISSHFYFGRLMGRNGEGSRSEFSQFLRVLKALNLKFPKLWDFVGQYNFRKLRVFKILFGQVSSILIFKRAHEQQPKNTCHLLSFYKVKDILISRK